MSGVVKQTILVPQPLNDRKILAMPLERSKAGGQSIGIARFVGGRIPGLFGDPPTTAER